MLDDRRLRPNLLEQHPLAIKGKHVEMGFDSGPYRPTCFASNQHNELQAIQTRVICDTQVATDALDDCIAWAKMNHRYLFRNMHKVESVPFHVYLERSNASPGVKVRLKQTYDELCANGITEHSALTRSQLYMYTKRSAFVKCENDLYNSAIGTKHKAPRLIQGAQSEFICLVGPWIMALQDLLKRRWGLKNFICFTSGITAKKAAEFINGGVGKWLEDDLAKFDSTIRRPWCEYEVWLCKQFGAPRAVIDLMEANISTHGHSHHGWKYKCDGTRKSGDPYTSLMNSIINGLSHAYLYCRWTGKSVLQCVNSMEFRMLAQGDDNAMRHPELVEFPWAEGMASLGFESEAIYRAQREHVEFCSSRLYVTTEGVVFGPKPGRVLAKMGYIINPPQGVTQQSMMRGIALGLKTTADFIPPIQVVIDRVLQLTEGHDAWYERKNFEAFSKDVTPVGVATEEVMLSLNMNYDWDYGKQSEFSKSISGMKFGDKYPIITNLLFDRDTGGPQDIFGARYPDFVAAAA